MNTDNPTVSDEEAANAAARSAMGEFAWPTVVLATGLGVIYAGVFLAYSLGVLPLWLATAITAITVYASYTVLHEAVHGSICGRHREHKRLNDAFGFVAGQIIGTSFIAHRKEHLTHHNNTNVEGHDPDLPLAGKGGFHLVIGALRALPYQMSYYLERHWEKASRGERRTVVLETVIAIAWRAALAIWLGPVAALCLLVVANLVGIFITLVLFAWIVHRPHGATGRYQDTSSFVFPRALDTLISGAWLFQNYHAIHHLFPRVPFYRYRQVFRQIEPVMIRQGAPIHRIGARSPRAPETTSAL